MSDKDIMTANTTYRSSVYQDVKIKMWKDENNESIQNAAEHFEPRDYQLEMLNISKNEDTIVMMPTGSGKTYIAVLLIQHFSYELTRPFINENFEIIGKRTVFIVNNVPLVKQQAKVISDHTGMKVGCYSGAISGNITSWDKKTWLHEFHINQVLVMTAKVFYDILESQIVNPSCINVLVIDECHHAKGNHPMALIMKNIWKPAKEKYEQGKCFLKPGLILGLTASVIDKKVSDVQEIRQTIDSLCNIMCRSKLITPAEFTNEIKSVKLPEADLVLYKNAFYARHILEQMYNVIDTLKDKTTQNLLQSYEVKALQSIIQLLEMVVVMIREIGVDCVDDQLDDIICEVNRILSNPMLSGTDDDANVFLELGRNTICQLHLIKQAIQKCMVNGSVSRMSKKFLSLIKTLLEKVISEEGDSPRIIIFMERRRVVRAVFAYLNKLANEIEECSRLKCCYVIGGTSGDSGESDNEPKQIRKQQEEALISFRDGKRNVLLATSVIEEGLDIPTCNFVIRYDFTPTYRSYVQSRGRARKKPSQYLFFIDETEYTQKKADLAEFRKIEKYLRDYANSCFKSWAVDERESSESVDSMISPLESEESKAKLFASSAIQRLNYYCMQLPSHDEYTDLKPVIHIETVLENYVCTITLPKICPIRTITGDPMNSPKLAKISCAMKTVQELYRIHELDDRFYPHFRTMENAKVKFEEEDFSLDMDERIKIPDTFFRKSCNEETEFYLYSLNMHLEPCMDNFIEYFSKGKYHKIQCFGVLSKEKIPDIPRFDVYPRYGKVTVQVRFERVLKIRNQLTERYKWFQKALFSDILFIRNIKHNSEFLFKNYFILPLVRIKRKDETIEYAIADMFIVKLQRRWNSDIENWKYENIPSNFDDCIDMVIHRNTLFASKAKTYGDMFDNNAFFIVIGKSDKTANDIMDKSGITYKDHHEKDGITIHHPDEQLLKCRHISKRYNMLPPLSKGYDKHAVHIIREVCKVHPFPASLWNQATCIPSVLWRIEALTLTYELHTKISPFSSIAINPPKTHFIQYFSGMEKFQIEDILGRDNVYKGSADWVDLFMCVCTKACKENLNLERLEFIGDNFLKLVTTLFYYRVFPDKHEGWLSRYRSRAVGNKNLSVQSTKHLRLPKYVLNKEFKPKDQWIPPYCIPTALYKSCLDKSNSETFNFDLNEFLLNDSENRPDMLNKLCELIPEDHKQQLKIKDIADSCEAIIGLCFVRYGYRVTVDFLDSIDVLTNQKQHKLSDVIYNANPPPPRIPEEQLQHARKVSQALTPLEGVLKYQFKDKLYLLEALTHVSYNDINACYQRMEFLGDTILDILIACYIYQSHPEMDPGQLSDLKSALVRNSTLAKICTKQKLYHFLKYNSPELYNVLSKFYSNFTQEQLNSWANSFSLGLVVIPEIEEDTLDEQPVFDLEYKVVQTPKILGDIVESVIGAIYLDCGEDMSKVWEVIWPWFEPYYNYYSQHPCKGPRAMLYELYPGLKTSQVKVDQYLTKATVQIADRDSRKVYKFVTIDRQRDVALDVSFERAFMFHRRHFSFS